MAPSWNSQGGPPAVHFRPLADCTSFCSVSGLFFRQFGLRPPVLACAPKGLVFYVVKVVRSGQLLTCKADFGQRKKRVRRATLQSKRVQRLNGQQKIGMALQQRSNTNYFKELQSIIKLSQSTSLLPQFPVKRQFPQRLFNVN